LDRDVVNCGRPGIDADSFQHMPKIQSVVEDVALFVVIHGDIADSIRSLACTPGAAPGDFGSCALSVEDGTCTRSVA
jgi:hypothetical protein